MNQSQLFIRFSIAIAIGFMVGLQREFAKGLDRRTIPAGERTFALMGLIGWLAAMVADQLNASLAFFGVLVLFGVFTVSSYLVNSRRGHVGLTTEMAEMITFLTGALCYWNYLILAAAIGIITTALLSLKIETDRFVRALTRKDIFAALQFAVISAVILPVLPNRSFLPPPLDVLNPYKIWLMVVFISGISFLGYVAIKIVGTEQGIGLTGLLGGIASSTAVTLSFSERSSRKPELSQAFAFAIMLGWAVMFSRVLVEVGVLNIELLKLIWIPIAASGLAGLIYVIFLFFSHRQVETADVKMTNPFDLGAAIKFGLIYAFILLISRTAQVYLGDTGFLISSFIAGLADVDAIALSVSELSKTGGLSMTTASRAVVIAAMANTLSKGGIVLAGGSAALRKALWPGIVLMLAVGIGLTFTL
jgi:uncharacterized membrane protein (DUF4010 family)